MSTTEQVHACIQGMFDALSNLDIDNAVSFLADTHCVWNVRAGDLSDPTIWKAGHYGQRADFKDFMAKHKSWKVRFKHLHTDIWEDPEGSKRTAVVVLEESGNAVFNDGHTHEWNEVRNLWALAEINGTWKITGSMHHIGESA